MHARLTPQYTFGLAAIVAALGITLSLWMILQAPWFGVQLDAEPDAVGQIIAVDDSAAHAGLRVGDKVLAFSVPGGDPVALQPLSLVSDPDRTGSFTAMRELFTHVGALHAATRLDATELHLADGRVIELAGSSRPFSSLSLGVWVMAAGVVPFLVGAGVWSYRRRDPASRLLLLAGASFMGIALSNLMYAYRQPSIDPLIFEIAVQTNRLSTLLFFFSYIAVFWVYPRRLGPLYVVVAGLVVFLLFFVNELTQTVHWPGDPFAFPLVATFPLSVGLIAVQWFHSRRNPVDRAALQWFVLAMMTGMVLVTGLYFLPGLVGSPPMLSLELAFAIGIVSYLGLIMAVVRYRLFQLGEWWLTAWMWLLGGGAVIALDVTLAYLLNVAPAYVVALSIFLVGWVYFPLRQWLWMRLYWHGSAPMTWLPKELLQTIVSARGEAALAAAWHELLNKLFRPLQITPLPAAGRAPAIDDDGLTLRVPNLAGAGGVLLAYRSDGRRLFSPGDLALLSSLLQMAGPAVDAQAAREAATQRERERIMRDLHDDVGARLLTLSHRLHDPDDAEMVGRAMQALRETIYSLNRPEGVDVATALADWRHEILERLESQGISLDWRADEANLLPLTLTAVQRLNLGQVLREAVSNAMRHGQPEHLWLSVESRDSMLRIAIGSDGQCEDPAQWQPGTGVMNMRRRMHEVGGHVEWRLTESGCCVDLELPLGTSGLVPPQTEFGGDLRTLVGT